MHPSLFVATMHKWNDDNNYNFNVATCKRDHIRKNNVNSAIRCGDFECKRQLKTEHNLKYTAKTLANQNRATETNFEIDWKSLGTKAIAGMLLLIESLLKLST